MSLSNPQKTVSPAAIDCRDTATVTLSFDAAASLTLHPMDLILIMDRSASMTVERIFYAKQAARLLVRTIADASAPAGGTTIGGGSRVGMVSFGTAASLDVPLTDNVNYLTTAISSLRGAGDTNHRAAFEKAEKALGPRGQNRQIAVMFTDGLNSVGGDATDVTNRMKAAGVEIYCIGLLASPAPLEQWASTPYATYIASTNDPKELSKLFTDIAARTVIPGAQKVLIKEQVSEDFEITALGTVGQGAAQITGPRTLTWSLDHAGVTLDPETISMSFEIRHIGIYGGIKAFNEALAYEDLEGNTLVFPSPVLTVHCKLPPIYPEPCPPATDFTVPGCRDAVRVDLQQTDLLSLGRIVQLNVTLKSVCPGKRVAVSVILSELAADGTAYKRGVKHILVPAQQSAECQDLNLNCIPFSVPEALNADGNTGSLCSDRKFQAQVIANYVDTDFACCDSLEAVIQSP